MNTLLGWALAAAIIANVAVFVLLLASSRRHRGGDIDLTPAAARGELDLNWDDPRWDDEGLTPIETHSLLGREV